MPEDLLDLSSSVKNLGFILHDVARMSRKRFEQRARAADLGLTRALYSVLAHLSRREGCNQTYLAQVLEIEPITLVKQLDRLEELDLIERRPHPTDRRTRLLFLKPAAYPLLKRIHALAVEVREEAMTGLSEQDRERLVAALMVMKSNLAAKAGDPDGAVVGE
jgi:DNA-binding MarR family transcriptional regulator